MTREATDRRSALDGKHAVRNGVVAAALLAVEFIAGMQTYVLRTIIPIVGNDLNAHEYYGVINGVAQVTMFLTMPLGPYLVHRFRVDRILLHLTWLTLAGGILSAIAPSVGVFILGRALSGLASGALSTVSLAAIVTVLPAGWRRAVLAGYNVMWVCTSLLGPLYAGWVASVLSWRWTLVIYLPLLMVARAVIARQLRGTMQPGGSKERLSIGSAIVLASGVALLSVVGLQGMSAGMAVLAGVAGTIASVVAARWLLPRGTLRALRGRPAAVATMGLLTGAYFGAAAIVAIIVHDVFDGSAADVALVLAGGGISWAVAGLAVSRWPAQAPRAYIGRSTVGSVLLAAGLLITGIPLFVSALPMVIGIALVGWTVAGFGMGLLYLDTLNHIVDVPVERDEVSPGRAAAAAILVEAIATAITSTIATALLGRAVSEGDGGSAAATILVLSAVIALSILITAHRVRSTTN